MYVCMYVCVYVCIYECMYIYMYIYIYMNTGRGLQSRSEAVGVVCMYVSSREYKFVFFICNIHACIVCVYVAMYVCKYVHKYMYDMQC